MFDDSLYDTTEVAEIFSQEITSLADPETAKTIPLVNSGIAPFWSAWNQFMTAALARDIPLCLEL